MEVEAQDRRRAIPQERRVQQTQSRAITQAQVERQLERWKGVCVICKAHGRECDHSISQCGQADVGGAEMERKRWQGAGGIKYTWGVACYRCGVPQSICRRSDERGISQSGGQCQFFGVVIGVVVGIKHGFPEVWQQWLRRMQREGVELDDRTVVQWMGGGDAIGTFRCSRLLAAFMWMVQRVEEQS